MYRLKPNYVGKKYCGQEICGKNIISLDAATQDELKELFEAKYQGVEYEQKIHKEKPTKSSIKKESTKDIGGGKPGADTQKSKKRKSKSTT